MKIGIQTWGSDGDINPFIALAGGLAAAGHDVTLALTSAERKDYGGYAQRLGFRLVSAGHIGRDEHELIGLARRMFEEKDPLKQLDLILEGMFEPGVDRMREVAEELCRDCDIMIGHFIVHPAHAVAERTGRPYLTVTLNHSAIPSRHVNLMGTPDLGPFLNGLFWKLGHKILNSHIIPHVNRLRRNMRLPVIESYRTVWESPRANLVAVSDAICGRWLDREPHQQVCGVFRMTEAAEPYEMPADLERFLAAGPAPVYCTFGSMTSVDDDAGYVEQSRRLLVDAVVQAGCRAIVQARWDGVTSVSGHPDIYRIGHVPHGRILPRCAAMVHHGGAGTTHTALQYGLPAVVVPHISDQFFWARELHRLGVAPKAVDRKKITVRQLAASIRTVLDDAAMGQRARELGRIMERENGVATAVAIIERIGAGLR